MLLPRAYNLFSTTGNVALGARNHVHTVLYTAFMPLHREIIAERIREGELPPRGTLWKFAYNLGTRGGGGERGEVAVVYGYIKPFQFQIRELLVPENQEGIFTSDQLQSLTPYEVCRRSIYETVIVSKAIGAPTAIMFFIEDPTKHLPHLIRWARVKVRLLQVRVRAKLVHSPNVWVLVTNPASASPPAALVVKEWNQEIHLPPTPLPPPTSTHSILWDLPPPLVHALFNLVHATSEEWNIIFRNVKGAGGGVEINTLNYSNIQTSKIFSLERQTITNPTEAAMQMGWGTTPPIYPLYTKEDHSPT